MDKSGLIAIMNNQLYSQSQFISVSRARRFGKSMALQMLYAYYDKSCDPRHLFEDLSIAKGPTFEKHLNKYPTIHLNITSFINLASDKKNIVVEMKAITQPSLKNSATILSWQASATTSRPKNTVAE